MRYYFLRLLTLTKRATGYAMTKLASLYNYLSSKINAGIQVEVTKIEDLKQRNIDTAKENVVLAAQRVIELKQKAEHIEFTEGEKADIKINNIRTKIGV